MRKEAIFIAAYLFFTGIALSYGAAGADTVSEIPEKGMVTMLDLGAYKCIPCKMMAPVLEKIEAMYKGRAAIIFVDVSKHRDQGIRFGIWSIPTQIFFDKNGKEVYRHVGFMSEKAIVEQLTKMGVDQNSRDEPKKMNPQNPIK